MPRSRPRRLIYTLSFGDEIYRDITDRCVHSLRAFGKFDGDLIVLTDGVYKTSRPDVSVVNVGDLREQPVVKQTIDVMRGRTAQVVRPGQSSLTTSEDPFPPALRVLFIKAFKSFAAPYIDVGKYDQIAVMDSDMIALSDINPLFRSAGDAVVGMTEYPFNTMTATPCGGGLLSLNERARASRMWGINTGFLSMPAHALLRVMRMWREGFIKEVERANEWADQPYFNHLVLRRKLRFSALPRHWIDMPPMYPWFRGEFRLAPTTKLLHLCVPEKESCLRQMSALVESLAARHSRTRIEKMIRSWLSD